MEGTNKKLYDKLISTGRVTPKEIGDFETFNQMLQDPENGVKLYNNLRKDDLFTQKEIGDQETFFSLIEKPQEKQPQQDQTVRQDTTRDSVTPAINPDAQAYMDFGGTMKDVPDDPGNMEGFWEEQGKRAHRGALNLNQMLANTPDFLNRMAVEAFNMSIPGRGIQGIGRLIGQNWKMKAYDLRPEEYNEYVETEKKKLTNEIAKLNPKHEQGILESAQRGDWATFVRNLAGGVADSFAPSVAMMVSGAGMAAPGMIGSSAVVFGAGKYAEMDQQAPDMPEETKVTAAAVNGALEGIFETFLGSGAVGKAFRNIVAKEGRQAATDMVKKGIVEGFADVITRNPAMAPFGEGVEEWGTQVGQNFVDIVSGYRPNIDLFDGATDALLIGVASGLTHSGPMYAAQGAVNLADKAVNQQQSQETVTPEQENIQPDPQQQIDTLRTQARKEAENSVNSNLHKNGMFVTIEDTEGNLWNVKSGDLNDKDGVIIVYDDNGNPKPISVDEVKNWESRNPVDVIQEFTDKFENEIQQRVLQPQVGERVDYQGQPYVIIEDLGNDFALIDDKQNVIEVPKEQLIQQTDQQEVQQETAPQQAGEAVTGQQTDQQRIQPKQKVVNTIPIGKNQYKYTVDESGTFDIQLPEGMDPAKAEKEIRATLPEDQQSRVQVIQEDVEVQPDVPWGTPTTETITKGIRILPVKQPEQQQQTEQQQPETVNNLENKSEKFTETEIQQPETQETNKIQQPESSQKIEPGAESSEQKQWTNIPKEEFIEREVRDYNIYGDEQNIAFRERIEPIQEQIQELNGQLKNIKGRSKEKTKQRKAIKDQIESLKQQEDQMTGEHYDKGMSESLWRRNVVGEIIKERGLDLDEDQINEIADEVTLNMFERPGIEYYWDKKIGQAIDDAIGYYIEESKKEQDDKLDTQNDANVNRPISEVESGNDSNRDRGSRDETDIPGQPNVRATGTGISEQGGGENTRPGTISDKRVQSELDPLQQRIIDRYNNEEWDRLIEEAGIFAAANNQYYAKPFEEYTGFKLPSEARTKQAQQDLIQALKEHKAKQQPDVKENLTTEQDIESEQEAMKRVNPQLYKLAQKANTVDEFVELVAKSSNSSVKDIDDTNLREWYSRVQRPESGKKEPWEMTREEFAEWMIENEKDPQAKFQAKAELERGIFPEYGWVNDGRKGIIKQALSEGKPVPEEVLKDYPELQVKQAEQEVDTNPTEAQKEAGNYKKGHVKINGYDITIETVKGEERIGDGWKVTMQNSYGYFKRTNGTEGKKEAIDVFLGDNLDYENVYVIDQVDPETGEFDEHKVMLGFNSEQEAKDAYLSNYTEGWQGFGAISTLSNDEFSKWLKQNEPTRAKRKPVSEMVTLKKESEKEKQGNLTEPVTEGTDTRNGSTYYLVKLTEQIDDKTGLNKLAKQYKGGYSKFAKGYLFRRGDNPQENAEQFRQEVEQKYSNDEYKEPRSTETIESEIKTIENEVETVKDRERAGQLLEEIDDILSDVEANLTLKQEGYSTEGINHEYPNIEVAKKIKRDVTKFSKTLAKGLGWEHDTNRRGKKEYAHANIAPAGGDATFILWKPNSDYGVYVSIPYQSDWNDKSGFENYQIEKKDAALDMFGGTVLWRITSKDRKYTGFGNQFTKSDVSVGKLAKLIKEAIKPYEAREQANTELQKKIDQIKDDKLPEDHPLMILDRESPQFEKALDEYLAEKNDIGPKEVDINSLVNTIKKEGEAKLSDHYKKDEPRTPLESNLKKAEERVNKKSEKPTIKEIAEESDNIIIAKPGATPKEGFKKPESPQESTQSPQDSPKENIDKEGLKKEATNVSPKNAPNTPKNAPKQSDYGKNNKIFTEDAANKARELLRKKLGGQLNAGIDPEIFTQIVHLAGYHIEAGVRKFADFAQVMVNDIGEGIKPYLKGVYENIRVWPGMQEVAKEMDSQETVNNFDLDKNITNLAENQAESETKEGEDRIIDKQNEDQDGNEQKTTDDNQADLDERESATHNEGVPRERNVETDDNKQRGESQEAGSNVETEERETSAGRNRGNSSQRSSSDRSGLSDIEQKSTHTGETVQRDNERSPKLKPEQRNHVIEPDDVIVPGGEIAKIRANIKAIELAKTLEKNNREATPEEKKILAQYVGWGGLSQVFKNEYWKDNWKKKYGKHYNRIQDLLTPEELSAAKESTINAHYTDRSVINALWKMVEKMGFKGGRVLEPAGGIGHFFGLMPENLQQNSQLRGVELDAMSGLIFSKLYPQAKIDVKGFEQVNDPNNHYDLAITNVPFAGIHVHDSLNKDISKDFTLHNYFIAKSVRLLKPGGVGVFITTSSTMDNEGQGNKFRQWLNSNEGGNADLIDAIRLPNNAFKGNAGTEVTTDILFIRKRDGETRHPLAQSFLVNGDYGQAKTQKIEAGYKNYQWHPESGGETVTIRVNEFYLNNPDRMLGQMKLAHEVNAGGLYTPNQPTLHAPASLNVEEELSKIADNFHENVFEEKQEVKDEIVHYAKEGQREGQLVSKDGKPYIVEYGVLAETGWNDNNVTGNDNKKYTKAEVVDKYNELKDAVIDLVNAESNPDSNDEQVEQLRKQLNKVYNSYSKTIGVINGNRKTYFLRADVDYSLVSSLEDIDKVAKQDKKGNWHYEDVIKKADIFSKRTNRPRKQPDKADSLEDAIDISNAYRNGLDINYISQLLNRDKESIKQELLDGELAYENPITGILEDRDTYLSGWVRKKLKNAEEAAKKDNKYSKNVEALKNVIPKDIPLLQIHAQIGAPWIPNDIVGNWIDNLLEVKGTRAYHNKVTDKWSVDFPYQATYSVQNTNEHAAGGFEAQKLIVDALNQRQPIAYDIYYDGDKKRQVKNEENTIAAQNKIGEFKVMFQDAIWDLKGEEADRVIRAYNDVYNAWVNKKITIPKNLKTFPGAVSEIDGKTIELRTHQKIAVKRALQEATMFAHQVGTGKTFSLITTAMEMKRLGIAKKPMIVVQRATTSQFVSWFRKLYPGAKLLVPDSKDLEASERKRLFAKIGLNEWDAVIIYHDFLTRIPDKPDRQIAYIRERIAELEAVSQDDEVPMFGKTDNEKEIDKLYEDIAKIQEQDRRTQESLEEKSSIKNQAKSSITQRTKLQRQFDRATDQVLYFEDMGIDALLVDEAHTFKRLGLATKGGNVKGIDTAGSQKSLSAKLKTRFILENNNNKNVVFATGTPISNTMAEAYTMMNYLIPERLNEHGVNTFDDFRTTFGHIKPSLEFTAAGSFKNVDRFAEYINLPELQRLWQSVADVVLTEEIDELKAGVGTPELKDNKYTQVHIKQTNALADMMEDFKHELRAWENLPGKEKRELRHVPLVIFNQAKRAAVDVRLVDPSANDDPGSKVNVAVEKAYELYQETNSYKGTQLIFSDVIESSDGNFNLYEEVKKKLIAKGVPEKEIQIISDHNTDAKREKLFDKINNGKVRFLIGSTDKMGIGVNVQERLKAVHHLDAPARPMDFEQRNGRLLRQGNLHLEMKKPVEVLLYGVEKTLDATAYQRLAIKQKFIRQMMKKGISVDRTLEDEDVDAQGQTFDQMMANLSGSQYAIVHIKKSYDLRMAEMDKRNFERKQIDAHDQIRRNNQQIAWDKEGIENTKKHIEYFKENLTGTEITSLKISNGKEITEDIYKNLENYADEIDQYGKEVTKSVTINGKIKGAITFIRWANEKTEMKLSVLGGTENPISITGWNSYKSARGLFSKMFDEILDMPNRIERLKKYIEEKTNDNKKLQEIVNQKYPKQDKLDKLKQEVAELERKMQEETSEQAQEIDQNILDDDFTSIKEVADIPNLKLDYHLAQFLYNNREGIEHKNQDFEDIKKGDKYLYDDQIVEVIRKSPDYKEIGVRTIPANEGDPVNTYDVYAGNLIIDGDKIKNLENQGFIDEFGDLTAKGERFVDLVNKRKVTRRRAKLGIDLFPQQTNIPEITGKEVDYTDVRFKGTQSTVPQDKQRSDRLKEYFQQLFSHAKNTGTIHVVETIDQVPETFRQRADEMSNTQGFFIPGTGETYFVTGNIESEAEAFKTWVHEVGVHKGLRNIIPAGIFNQFCEKIVNDVGESEVDKILPDDYKGKSKAEKGEEYLAHLGEKIISEKDLTTKEKGIWTKIVEAVKNILNKLFTNVKFTNRDVNNIVKAAVQSVYQGQAKNENIPVTETKAFKDWFKDSKVVDENGNPLVVYHGTDAEDFNVFDGYDNLNYFTEHKTYADLYTYNSNIKDVYLSIKNPLDLTVFGIQDITSHELIKFLEDKGVQLNESVKEAIRTEPKARAWEHVRSNGFAFRKSLQNTGFDGIKQYDTHSFGERLPDDVKQKATVWIAFSPTQIKSATGNRGTFDSNNPDIRFRSKQKRPQRDDFPTIREYLTALEDYYKNNPDQAPQVRKKANKVQNTILNNNGLIDKTIEAHRVASELYEEKKKEKVPIKETIGKVREFWFEEVMPLRTWQEEIIKRGGKLPKDVNPYRDMRNMFGRMEALYRKFQDENMNPIKETIAKIVKTGMKSNGILPYLIAKHGLERNRVMREQKLEKWKEEFKAKENREPSMEEILDQAELLSNRDFAGVGPLSAGRKVDDIDELTQNIIDGFEKQVSPELVKELWKNINRATDYTLETWKDGGQITEKQYKQYKKQYKYFVPLRGWKDDAAKFLRYKNNEGGIGRSLKHALGRTSVADNPLAYIQSVNFKAINEKVTNEIKQETFKVILDNYGEKYNDLHQIKRVYLVEQEVTNEDGTKEDVWMPYTDKHGNIARPPKEMFDLGMVETEVNNEHFKLRTPHNAYQHEVYVKNNGKLTALVFPGKSLPIAQVLNNQNTMAEFMGVVFDTRKLGDTWIFRGMSALTNFMKSMMTSYNPVFPLTNFFRDQPEAAITQFIRQNSMLAKYPAKYSPLAAKAIARHMAGVFDANNKYDVELRKFYEAGGTTGFTHEKRIEDLEKELKRDIKRALRSSSFRGKTFDKLTHILKYIEQWNRMFEDTTRFAVYLSAREKKLSVKDSAFESRNASVDFNMKGKGTRVIEAAFAFFKAGINALQKNFQLAKNKPAKFTAVATTVVSMGFLEAMLNDWGDDDDEYYRLNDYVRENYFVLKQFWGDEGKYLRVPLPQFWRGFHAMGVSLYDFCNDKITAGEVVGKTISNMLAGMAPIDVTGFIYEGRLSSDPLWPTFVKPIREIVVNRDFMGNKIAYEAFTKALEEDLADSGLHKRNVNPAAKLFTDLMFKAGGGEGNLKFKINDDGELKYVPNLMDINPSKVEHFINGYLGGTGRFINDGVTSLWQWASEEKVDWNNVPFFNSFIRNVPEEKWQVIRQYQDFQKYIEDADRYRSKARSNYEREKLEKYYTSDHAKAKKIFNAYDKAIESIMEKKGFDSEDASEMITDLMKKANIQLEKLNIKK